jgi:hypothetical protein
VLVSEPELELEPALEEDEPLVMLAELLVVQGCRVKLLGNLSGQGIGVRRRDDSEEVRSTDIPRFGIVYPATTLLGPKIALSLVVITLR